MRKITIIIIALLASLGVKAQMAQQFFSAMPSNLPSVSDLVAVAFPSEDDPQGANERIEVFVKKINNAMHTVTFAENRQAFSAMRNSEGYRSMAAAMGVNIDALLDSLQNEEDTEIIEVQEVEQQPGAIVYSTHASGSSASLPADMSSDSWRTDYSRWKNEYEDRILEINLKQEELNELLDECIDLFFHDHGKAVTELNRDIDENIYQRDYCFYSLEDDQPDPHDHEGIDERLTKARLNHYRTWSRQTLEKALPLVSELLGLIKKNVPLAQGMDRYMREMTENETVPNTNEFSMLMKYSGVMQRVESLGKLNLGGIDI